MYWSAQLPYTQSTRIHAQFGCTYACLGCIEVRSQVFDTTRHIPIGENKAITVEPLRVLRVRIEEARESYRNHASVALYKSYRVKRT